MIHLNLIENYSKGTQLTILGEAASFTFASEVDLRETPQIHEAIKGALTSWAAIDSMASDAIWIHYPLSEQSELYIQRMMHHACETYSAQFPWHKPKIHIEKPLRLTYTPWNLNPDKHVLYSSGGKDSFVCREILQKMGITYRTSTVSYDHDASSGVRIFRQIRNERLHNSISPTGQGLEESDIPLTFLSGLIGNFDHAGTFMAGLPYEFQEVQNGRQLNLVPTESFLAMDFLQQYLNDLGVLHFKLVSPIACLTSLGVHGLILRQYGTEVFDRFVSCPVTDNHEAAGQACGTCDKCRRIKAVRGMEDGSYESPAAYADLFGNLLRLFDDISLPSLTRTIVLRSHHSPFHYDVAKCLTESFGKWVVTH